MRKKKIGKAITTRTRSKSAEILCSWDQPEFEEVKNKFDALIRKEAKAEIPDEARTRKISQEEPFYDEFIDLLKDDKVRADSTSSNIDETDSVTSNNLEEESDSEDSEYGTQKVIETKLEEEDKLLVGIAEGKEVILGGTVEELFSNLTTKRFGKIISSSNDLITPPFVVEFLFTYRYFANSEDAKIPPAQELMSRLIKQYPVNLSPDATPEQVALDGTIQLRIIGVLKNWMENHFYDFEDDTKLFQQLISLLSLIQQNMSNSSAINGVQRWYSHLQKLLEEQLIKSIRRGSKTMAVMALREHINSPTFDEMTQNLFVALIKRSELLKKKKGSSLSAITTKTFTGIVFTDWIMSLFSFESREDAIRIGEKLISSGVIQEHKKKGGKFNDQPSLIYELAQLQKSDSGNSVRDANGTVTTRSPLANKISKQTNFIELKPMEVARQMTMIDYAIFKKITPKELSHQSWNKENAKEVAPNVVRMIERFNEISYWSATELVLCPNLRKRVTILKRLIHVAEICKTLNNFSTALAIIGGLNLGCVQRMKKTWENLPRQYMAAFVSLTDFISSLGNFKNYRKLIRTVQPPAIPYIAVTLKDLTFIEDGNPNFRANGMVNFEKMSMLADVFSQIHKYQQQEYSFPEVPDVKEMLLNNLYVIRDDKELYKHSNICEAENQGPGLRVHKSASHSDVPSAAAKMNVKKKRSESAASPTTLTPSGSNSKLKEVFNDLTINRIGRTQSKDERPATKHSELPAKSKSEGTSTASKAITTSKSTNSVSKSTTNANTNTSKSLTGMKRSLKVVLVGDGMVGKTSLLISYTTKAFPQTEYIPTVFDNYNSIEDCDGQPVNLVLWDTAGQEDLAKIRTLNYAGTDCFIVCYSVVNRSSFLNIKDKWVPELSNHCPDATRILVGMKSDLLEDKSILEELSKNDETPVNLEEGGKMASKVGAVLHLQCSALKGINVQELFVQSMKSTIAAKAKKAKKKFGVTTKKK